MAWVCVLVTLISSLGISYLATLQELWQDTPCKGFCFLSVVKLLQQIPCKASCSLSSANGKALEHLLPCPDCSEMVFLPADPSFSLNELYSAKQAAIKSSPFPRSRLIYWLNFAAAFLLQWSGVPQHNLFCLCCTFADWLNWCFSTYVLLHPGVYVEVCCFPERCIKKCAVPLYLFWNSF